MSLVVGIDSSTRSCKVVVCEAETGTVVRSGTASHPEGTEVDPASWLSALDKALAGAGGLDDVAGLSVAAQQHGMICLDEYGNVVRPALLWNDTRSADAATALVAELGGPISGGRVWADAVGSVPVASFTVTKLRWLAEHEPESVRRTASVCLPHDWLTWRLGGGGLDHRLGENALATDRSEASGTGYFSPTTNSYRFDLLEMALGRVVAVPGLLQPTERAGHTAQGVVLGPGSGDNAAGALSLLAGPGDAIVSLGTSGTVFATCKDPVNDPTGTIAGFADATGQFLPLVCTLNAARVLEAVARVLRVDLDELSALALSAPAGAGGLVLVPYFEGERTPNLPFATGAIHGLRHNNSTPAHLARAAIEGMLCGLAAGLDALLDAGIGADRVILIGGVSRSEAVRQIAAGILDRPVVVPDSAEHVAIGAARQAAWTLAGSSAPPSWRLRSSRIYEGEPFKFIRERYAEVAGMSATVAQTRLPPS